MCGTPSHYEWERKREAAKGEKERVTIHQRQSFDIYDNDNNDDSDDDNNNNLDDKC